MRLLSLDTSFSFINFSVIEEGKVTLFKYVDNDKKALENIPTIMESEGIRVEDFDAFAVSRGVGYLTSVRIGVTFMKTLAYLHKKPILSYENLYILGSYTEVAYPRIPFLKVSRNIFYRVFETGAVSEIKLLGKGEKLSGRCITLKQFAEFSPTEEVFTYQIFPFSAYGGMWAWEKLRENPEGENLFLLEPVYLKPPV